MYIIDDGALVLCHPDSVSTWLFLIFQHPNSRGPSPGKSPEGEGHQWWATKTREHRCLAVNFSSVAGGVSLLFSMSGLSWSSDFQMPIPNPHFSIRGFWTWSRIINDVDLLKRCCLCSLLARVSSGLELAARPTVLYLDEPTSGLDSTSSLQVINSLSLSAKGGFDHW